MTLLKVTLFGAFQVVRGGQPVTQFKSKAERALLVYLILNAGQQVDRRLVASMLWPESYDSAALHNLRAVLARLRKAIGTTSAEMAYIHATRQTLLFDPAVDFASDVGQFQASLVFLRTRSAERQRTHPQSIQHTKAALALYQDDLLPGFDGGNNLFSKWLDTQRRKYREDALWLAALAVVQAELVGDYLWMEQQARWLVEQEPWHEEAHQWLMFALHSQGRTQAAIGHYERLQHEFQMQLGVLPGTHLQAFFFGLLHRSDEGETLPDVHQVAAGNIPAPLMTYFGRNRTIATLFQRLSSRSQRWITLVGLGGIGKTQLALNVARKLHHRFSDGVWLVELVDVVPANNSPREAELALIQTIANAMQTALNERQPLDDQLIAQLRRRSCLLLLDNLDEFAAAGHFLIKLLQQAPKLSILATSRQPLHFQAEAVYPLDGLALFPTDDPNQIDALPPAIALFVDRVQRHQPEFAYTDNNRAQILALCKLLGGVPLALELAAASLEARSLDDLLALLPRSLAALETDAHDVPQRHRTLLQAIESSWQALPAAERQTLCLLSIFRQTFSLAAGQGLVGVSVKQIAQLSKKSLLHRMPMGRLQLHPLLRHFCREKLVEQGLFDSAEKQHAEYYLKRMQELHAALHGKEPIEAVRELEPDGANLQAAWLWAVKQFHIDWLAATYESYQRLLKICGLLKPLQRLLRLATERYEAEAKVDVLYGCLLIQQAHIELQFGDLAVTTRLLTQAFEALENAPDENNFAFASLVNGALLQRDGQPAAARELFEIALSTAERNANSRLRIRALDRLNSFLTQTTTYNEQAVKLAQAIGDRWLEARVFNGAGISAANVGDYEQAYRSFRQLAEYDVWITPNHIGKLTSLNNAGLSLLLIGAYDEALICFESGLRMAQVLQNRLAQQQAMLGISRASLELGKTARALEMAEAAFAHSKQVGGQADTLSVLLQLGSAQYHVGRLDAAAENYAAALRLSAEIGLEIFVVLARAYLIELEMATETNSAPSAAVAQAAAKLARQNWQILQIRPINPTLRPMFIYWQMVRALLATSDPQAGVVLQQALDVLHRHIDHFQDDRLRETFCAKVPANRELLRLEREMPPRS